MRLPTKPDFVTVSAGLRRRWRLKPRARAAIDDGHRVAAALQGADRLALELQHEPAARPTEPASEPRCGTTCEPTTSVWPVDFPGFEQVAARRSSWSRRAAEPSKRSGTSRRRRDGCRRGRCRSSRLEGLVEGRGALLGVGHVRHELHTRPGQVEVHVDLGGVVENELVGAGRRSRSGPRSSSRRACRRRGRRGTCGRAGRPRTSPAGRRAAADAAQPTAAMTSTSKKSRAPRLIETRGPVVPFILRG